MRLSFVLACVGAMFSGCMLMQSPSDPLPVANAPAVASEACGEAAAYAAVSSAQPATDTAAGQAWAEYVETLNQAAIAECSQ